jgi:hypothetical protein
VYQEEHHAVANGKRLTTFSAYCANGVWCCAIIAIGYYLLAAAVKESAAAVVGSTQPVVFMISLVTLHLCFWCEGRL